MFGIDKTVIKNWELKGIYLDKLLKNNNVIIQTQGYTTTVLEKKTKEYVDIAYIKVKDTHKFNVLQFGVKLSRGRIITYGFIDIHINSLENKINNLKPLSIKEYHKLIDSIREYLISEYGIYIDFKSAKFDKIELNKTIKLDRDFQEYKHMLSIISLLAPKTYKDKSIRLDKMNNIKQISVSNKSVEFKIYDKTKQLIELYGIRVDNQYLRIEYTLKTSKKVESVFKSSYIVDLADNKINNYLNDRIEKELINPIENHIKKGQIYLNRIAKEEKQRNPKKWVRSFVLRSINEEHNNVPILVCLEQLRAIIKKETKSNYARTIKRLKKDFEQNDKYNENLIKLEEIRFKIIN